MPQYNYSLQNKILKACKKLPLLPNVNGLLKKARDVKDIGHYSSGKTEITITDRSEIPYTLSLIKQAYEIS